MSENPDRYDEGQYVSYREFKEYTDKQAEREVALAKELAGYREIVSGKLASLGEKLVSVKNTQYVQLAMLAVTLLTVAGDLVYRVMHP